MREQQDGLILELLQVSLGARSESSSVPSVKEWASLYNGEKKQAIVEVIVDGFIYPPND